jgi:hypothetical protein
MKVWNLYFVTVRKAGTDGIAVRWWALVRLVARCSGCAEVPSCSELTAPKIEDNGTRFSTLFGRHRRRFWHFGNARPKEVLELHVLHSPKSFVRL